MKTAFEFRLGFIALLAATVPTAWAGQAQEPPAATTAPGAAGCGRISVFDVAPRSRDLYAARLLEIDGELAGPTNARNFRVSTGHHTLKVAELIKNSEFNDVQLRQRGQGKDLSKMLEIDVAPNTTYLLAAHFIESQRGNILDKGYWEPVIYQKNSESCK